MRVDAPKYGFHPTDADDPRVTRIGRWLRHTSLDELPQLFNVLKGDMSLVGPRPEMPFIVESYNTHHLQRLQVIPGLTGLWQLSADRSFLIHENIQYDLYYIRNCNFFMDLAILLHTAVFAMKGI
jgi:lipopolysaccharide/colanic/teichoic acid biosynthesis glycosyltransferase